MPISNELLSRATEVFRKKKAIKTGEFGLLRSDLRILEKHGYITKIRMFGARKYQTVNPPMYYLWQWVEKTNE